MYMHRWHCLTLFLRMAMFEANKNLTHLLIHIHCTQSNVVCQVWPISLKQGCVCHSMPLHWVLRQPLSQRTGAACGLGIWIRWKNVAVYINSHFPSGQLHVIAAVGIISFFYL